MAAIISEKENINGNISENQHGGVWLAASNRQTALISSSKSSMQSVEN
jgi:hypothetical protein